MGACASGPLSVYSLLEGDIVWGGPPGGIQSSTTSQQGGIFYLCKHGMFFQENALFRMCGIVIKTCDGRLRLLLPPSPYAAGKESTAVLQELHDLQALRPNRVQVTRLVSGDVSEAESELLTQFATAASLGKGCSNCEERVSMSVNGDRVFVSRVVAEAFVAMNRAIALGPTRYHTSVKLGPLRELNLNEALLHMRSSRQAKLPPDTCRLHQTSNISSASSGSGSRAIDAVTAAVDGTGEGLKGVTCDAQALGTGLEVDTGTDQRHVAAAYTQHAAAAPPAAAQQAPSPDTTHVGSDSMFHSAAAQQAAAPDTPHVGTHSIFHSAASLARPPGSSLGSRKASTTNLGEAVVEWEGAGEPNDVLGTPLPTERTPCAPEPAHDLVPSGPPDHTLLIAAGMGHSTGKGNMITHKMRSDLSKAEGIKNNSSNQNNPDDTHIIISSKIQINDVSDEGKDSGQRLEDSSATPIQPATRGWLGGSMHTRGMSAPAGSQHGPSMSWGGLGNFFQLLTLSSVTPPAKTFTDVNTKAHPTQQP